MEPLPEIDPSCPGCANLLSRLTELERVIEKQGAEIERLKARNATTSRTSSKPPSSDAPWARERPPRKRSGRKRGAQPGHAPKQRKPAPPEDIDDVQCVKPEVCSSCSAPLTGEDAIPVRHQVFDIPPVVPRVVEYQLHRLECAECGLTTRAGLPDGVHPSAFGPNLTALVCLLTGEYRMSRRRVQRFIEDTYGIEISLGAISNMERRLTDGLAAPHAEAMASVAKSATKHLDETTWYQSGELAWVWTAVGEDATVFVIRDTRASAVAKELIGEEPTGVTISDRFSGYGFIDLDRRQVCLAHLVRDFRRMAEGEKEHRWIGERLLGLSSALFRLWHLHRDERIDRRTLIRWTRSIRERTIRLLDAGARSRGYETPSLCRGILRTEPAMWTFVHLEGVEPTNNDAERALRPLVIHRRTSLGSQSPRGSRFIERSHTAAETLRRAGRNVHDFLLDVAHAVLGGRAVPALIL